MTELGKSTDTESLAAEINSSFEERRSPRFEQGNLVTWVEAINHLLSISHVDVAEHGLQYLRVRFPTATYANRVGTVFDRLPLAGTPLPFKDDPASDIQVVARSGADTVLMLFCGYSGNLGLPLSVVHRWTGRLDASLIYLRDFHRCFYLDGISSLGATREVTIAELRRIVASLGAKRIACYGGSAGVFAALHYGLDLNADAVLCLGGATNLSLEFNAYTIYKQGTIKVHADRPDAPPDLRRLYETAPRSPRVRIMYGADFWDDRIHAEHMRTLPNVTLEAVENFDEHNLMIELIKQGQFETALHWLVPEPQESHIAMLEPQMGTLDQSLSERNSEIDRLRHALADRNAGISSLKVTASALYASASWRVTAALRRARNAFSSFLNHD